MRRDRLAAGALAAVLVAGCLAGCDRVAGVVARPAFEQVCADSFDRGTTQWTLGGTDTRQVWRPLPGSRWGIRGLQAYTSLQTNFAVATIDCRATGDLLIQSDITLSPTLNRANVGLVFRYADPKNYLWAKVKNTRTDPLGALGIGKTEDGIVTSALGTKSGIGLENGMTYHVAVALDGNRIALTVSGGSLASPASISYTMTPDEALRFSGATRVGLLSRWYPGDPAVAGDPTESEDDGNSTWDNFVVSRI